MLVATRPGTVRDTVARGQDTAVNNAELDSFLVPICYECQLPKEQGSSDIEGNIVLKLVANKSQLLLDCLRQCLHYFN